MVKRKKIKLRKRTIHMSSNYYETIAHAPQRQKIM